MASEKQEKAHRRSRSVFSAEIAAKIVGLIRIGNYVETACLAAGIHKDTFYAWKARGAQGEEPYESFLDDIKQAEAVLEATLVGHLYQSCNGDPTHARTWMQNAKFLACRFRDRWANPERLEVSAAEGSVLLAPTIFIPPEREADGQSQGEAPASARLAPPSRSSN